MSLLPDVEKLTSRHLRSRPSITTLVSDRVYTAIPENPTFPLLLVRRVSGSPVTNRPLYVDAAVIQLDAYGGTKAQARDLIETARQEVATMEGSHAEGVVSGVTFGPMSWLPDTDYAKAKNRYIADFTAVVHP